jgi:hypothetical protein
MHIHIQRSHESGHILFWSTLGALKRTLVSAAVQELEGGKMVLDLAPLPAMFLI